MPTAQLLMSDFLSMYARSLYVYTTVEPNKNQTNSGVWWSPNCFHSCSPRSCPCSSLSLLLSRRSLTLATSFTLLPFKIWNTRRPTPCLKNNMPPWLRPIRTILGTRKPLTASPILQWAPIIRPCSPMARRHEVRPAQSLPDSLHLIISSFPTGSLDLSHPQQQMGFHNMNMMSPHQYTGPVYAPHTPHGLGLSNSPPPPSPDLYEALSPPASDSNNSVDGVYHSLSSGGNSPSSSRGNSLVHRHIRYNPSPSPTSSAGRRHNRSRSRDSDEEGMGVSFVENLAHTRKEATRRQRIEAEQRRRDELRDGYAKLKDVLPVSTQKSSKVSLLERGSYCNYYLI